jgi:hypothetical protein
MKDELHFCHCFLHHVLTLGVRASQQVEIKHAEHKRGLGSDVRADFPVVVDKSIRLLRAEQLKYVHETCEQMKGINEDFKFVIELYESFCSWTCMALMCPIILIFSCSGFHLFRDPIYAEVLGKVSYFALLMFKSRYDNHKSGNACSHTFKDQTGITCPCEVLERADREGHDPLLLLRDFLGIHHLTRPENFPIRMVNPLILAFRTPLAPKAAFFSIPFISSFFHLPYIFFFLSFSFFFLMCNHFILFYFFFFSFLFSFSLLFLGDVRRCTSSGPHNSSNSLQGRASLSSCESGAKQGSDEGPNRKGAVA